eukprot:1956256-Rhodomonas_salina.1
MAAGTGCVLFCPKCLCVLHTCTVQSSADTLRGFTSLSTKLYLFSVLPGRTIGSRSRSSRVLPPATPLRLCYAMSGTGLGTSDLSRAHLEEMEHAGREPGLRPYTFLCRGYAMSAYCTAPYADATSYPVLALLCCAYADAAPYQGLPYKCDNASCAAATACPVLTYGTVLRDRRGRVLAA